MTITISFVTAFLNPQNKPTPTDSEGGNCLARAVVKAPEFSHITSLKVYPMA